MAYIRLTTGKGDHRSSVTIPRYLWDALLGVMDEFSARQMVRSWGTGITSYEAAERIFRMVMAAAKQQELKIDDPENEA